MKLNVTMKTPNCLYYALGDRDEDDKSRIKSLCEKWFKYVEYVTLEIDTEKETCVVLEN